MANTNPYRAHAQRPASGSGSRVSPVQHQAPRFSSTLPGLGVRRQTARHKLVLRVEAIPLDGRSRAIQGSTEDVSARGLFIRSSRQLPVDALVVLKLYTPHGKLKVNGRVVHNISGLGFGCELLDLSEHQLSALSLLASSLHSCGATIH